MTIIALLILLFIVEATAAWIILRRLEQRHTDLWKEMGMPRFSELNAKETWWAMTRFIYGGACLRIDDIPLNILCASMVLGEVAIIYAIIF